jgi:hypothetical protein
MPFNFAHPAAAVPLARPLGRYGVLSALIIGSMTPDFAFLLPIGVMRAESHSLGGLFWYCLPIGIVFYAVFHLVVKQPIIHLLPPFMFARLEAFGTNDWLKRKNTFIPVVVSLLFGALTHLVWDSFTHRDSWAAQHFDILRTHLYTGGGFWVYLYSALQWFSSFLGLALLAWWGWRWLHRAPKPVAIDGGTLGALQRWLVTLALLVASLAGGVLEVRPYLRPSTLLSTQELVSHFFLGMVSGFGVALILYCALWTYWAHRRQLRD